MIHHVDPWGDGQCHCGRHTGFPCALHPRPKSYQRDKYDSAYYTAPLDQITALRRDIVKELSAVIIKELRRVEASILEALKPGRQ